MKFLKYFCVVVFVVFCCDSVAAAQKRHLSFLPGQSHVGSDVPIIEAQERAENTVEPVINVNFSGVWLQPVEVDQEIYEQLTIPETGLQNEVGKPSLPFKGVFVEIPYGVNAQLEIVKTAQISLGEDYNVLPAQPPEPDTGGSSKVQFYKDQKVYSQYTPYPDVPVKVEEPAFIRGQRVVFVKIFPLQYIPATGELIGYRNIEFRLKWSGEVDKDESKEKDRLKSPFFSQLPESLLVSKVSPVKEKHEVESIEDNETELYTENGADYLIITEDSFAASILPLANWKNRMGYKTKVVNLSTIGTTYTDVKDYIQSAYDSWTPAPSYVLLVGDDGYLPSYPAGFTHPYHGTSDWPTDHAYSLTAGSDYFSDLSVGRISVSSVSQCTTVVDKILEYERTPDSGSWWNDALIAAYFQDNDDNGVADRWFMETASHILSFLDTSAGYDIETAQTTNSSSRATYNYRSSSYPHRPTPPSPVPSEVVSRWTSASQSTTDVSTAVNGGVGLVFHRDHGSYTLWGDPPFSVSNVNALTNGTMTPVVLSINCLTGAYDYSSGDSFAEAWLKKSNGGGVGVVAATRVSYSGYNDLLAKGLIDSFWDNYDTAYTGSVTYPNSRGVADALNYSKYYMYTYYGSGTVSKVEFYIFQYFGDPSMALRTQSPQSMTVSYSTPISTGVTSLDVDVSVTDAQIAVEQNGLIIGRATSTGGTTTVSLTSPVTSGMLYITVTKNDYLPYEGSYSVSNSTPPVVLNPNPSDGSTVIEGPSGQLLRVLAPGATSGVIYYDGDATIDHSVAASINGDYLEATIPYVNGEMNNDGTNYWYVEATNLIGTTRYPSSGSLSFTVTLTPPPVVSEPSPSDGATIPEGASGQLLRVRAPGATSGVIYYDGDATVDHSVVATVNGNYLEATIPYVSGQMNNDGTNYWYVEATNPGGTTRYPSSGNLSFSVTPPPVVSSPSPPDGATVTENPSGQFLQVLAPGATSGVIYYDDDSNVSFSTNATVNGDYLEATIPYASGKMSSYGTNYWYVEATNGGGTTRYPSSGNLSFTVTSNSSLVISNPSPSDGATVDEDPSGQLLRVLVPGAISGVIYYDDDSLISFSTNATVNGDYLEARIPYASGQMNNNGINYWYVDATDSDGTVRYPSSGNLSFTVEPVLPPVVSSPIPSNGATVNEGPSGQLLRVLAPGATSGVIHYDGDATIDHSVVANIDGDYLEATIPYVSGQMNNDGTNYWYVEATNVAGTTRYPSSGNLSFTVGSKKSPWPLYIQVILTNAKKDLDN